MIRAGERAELKALRRLYEAADCLRDAGGEPERFIEEAIKPAGVGR